MTDTSLRFRAATSNDLKPIITMLIDDPLGATREVVSEPLPETYLKAFAAIEQDPHNELIVATLNHEVVGVLQLTFIPYLTYQGSWRALIEGVRVSQQHRGQGIGKALFVWAIERAKSQHCCMLQLTTNKQRTDALRFYESLGFVASHEGMKLHLDLKES